MPDREWMRSERRAENPGIWKEEDELRLDSWMQITSTGWNKKSEVVQCSWLEDLQHSIEEPRESQGGVEAQQDGQEQETAIRGQREKI